MLISKSRYSKTSLALRALAVLVVFVGSATVILSHAPIATAAIAPRGASVTAINSTAAITLTFGSMPTGLAAGDVLIGVFSTYLASATVSTITTGWTPLPANSSIAATNMKSFVYYKVADGTETAMAVTFSGTAAKNSGIISAFSGVDTVNIFASTAVAPKATTTAATSLGTNAFATSISANAAIVAAFGGYNTSSNTSITISAAAGSSPTMQCTATCQTVFTNAKTAPTPYSSMEYGILSSATTVTARSMTATQAMISTGFVFALNPYVPTTYTQSAYRFFNMNGTTLGTPLAAQSTPASIVEQTGFSLRQLVSVDTSNATAGVKNMKLQAAPKTTTCGTYADVPSTAAQVTNFPTTAVNDGSNGSSATWLNPDRVTAEDVNTASISSLTGVSQYIKTTGYGLSVPTNATIVGIKVLAVNKYNTAAASPYALISARPTVGGVITGNTLSNTAYRDTTIYGTTAISSTPASWGISITPADINATNFGFAVLMNSRDGGGNPIQSSAYIDSISIVVSYQLPLSAGLYLDNTNTLYTDGMSAVSNANDPTTGRSIVYQRIVASSPFNNLSAINSGSDGLWDIRLMSGPVSASTTYCLRIIDSSGTPLNTYSFIPEVTITGQVTGPTLDQQLRGGQSVINGTKSPLSF